MFNEEVDGKVDGKLFPDKQNLLKLSQPCIKFGSMYSNELFFKLIILVEFIFKNSFFVIADILFDSKFKFSSFLMILKVSECRISKSLFANDNEVN